MKTESVSPMVLQVCDLVVDHGATFEVVYIRNHTDYNACYCRLIGNDTGAIPQSWLRTPEQLVSSGAEWAKELPEGRYWNVQGNENARIGRVIK